jgi:aldose 1-epimerase
VEQSSFGRLADGRAVDRILLRSDALEVGVLTHGATVQSVLVPDRDGRVDDVVLGFDDLGGYLAPHPYFGATIGRYANRIAQARFTLDGVEHELPANNGPSCLHGGTVGFDRHLWTAHESSGPRGSESVELSHVSPDGDMGFPGALTATVTFTVSGPDLRIDYRATTERPTVVNMTNHSYFNLAGAGSATDHEVHLLASRFTPVDDTVVPTGEITEVAGTPLDFTSFRTIGSALEQPHDQLRRAQGLDHNWVIDGAGDGAMRLAAAVREPSSGRVMEVWTDQPGVQFYTGNLLDGTLVGKGGHVYRKGDAFCLETQHFPDSPNQPAFPSTALRPGETYRTSTVFRFAG